ncbi:DUF4178 domain-containing protein [Candidatus Berkiella aquae]|uniref:DUF4178 domain-containing protein n=1 Tax=Candidatus Berkiella aquae TaxID=295108 RepID=A0A0Q9YPE8_9GAMM|nr:DUF4178 domain-containing protein [Candidatus Berkiella aquae]MCS5709952.1 DUF4178 domain-containing protein [Candidatus Berkiella aquae]
MAGKYLHPDHKATPPQVEQLTCVKCGGALTLRAKGYTTTLVCPYCAALYNVTVNGLEIEGLSANKSNVTPYIPLGTRGKLHGATWEVIGFMQRRSPMTTWQEYLLFNPYKGFRWLTECLGHWNYVVTLHDVPKKNIIGNKLTYLDLTYQYYARYNAVVTYVVGEFYWRVKANDACQIEDYVCAPNILTQEKGADEQNWSLAEYIEPETIKTAFNLDANLPAKVGATINQPFKRKQELSAMVSVGVIGTIILAVFTFILIAANHEKTLSTGEFSAISNQVLSQSTPILPYNATTANSEPVSPNNQTPVNTETVSPTFEITDNKAFLHFYLYAPVNNSWVDLDAKLINEETGKSVYFESGVEYYHGYDEGYWSEGSTTNSMTFSALPKGKYHLVFNATTNAYGSLPVKYSLKQGGINGGSFFFTIFLMLLPSVVGLGYYFYFEYKRRIS